MIKESIHNNERDLPICFRNNIYKLRAKQGLSYQKLGDLIGVSASYIHKIEHGERRRVSYAIIKKLANTLNVRVADLLGEDPDNQICGELKRGIFLEMKSIISENNLTHQEKIQQLKAVADICQYLLVSGL